VCWPPQCRIPIGGHRNLLNEEPLIQRNGLRVRTISNHVAQAEKE
jgi:hypothetical protein